MSATIRKRTKTGKPDLSAKCQ